MQGILYFHIRALRHIRSSLATEACKTVAAAIVGFRLDYCTTLSLLAHLFRIWLACSLSRTHLLGSLPRNLTFATLRWAPTISLGSHQNTGARANVVLLTLVQK